MPELNKYEVVLEDHWVVTTVEAEDAEAALDEVVTDIIEKRLANGAYTAEVGDLLIEACGCIYHHYYSYDRRDDFAYTQMELHAPCAVDDPERDGMDDWRDYATEFGEFYYTRLVRE